MLVVPNSKCDVNHIMMNRHFGVRGRSRHPMRRMIVQADAKPARSDDQDLKLFVLSFTAFFVCFYTMIM